MSFFRHKTSGLLSELLKDVAESSPTERVSLQEELDLSRILALRALALFNEFVLPESSSASYSVKKEITEQATKAVEMVAELALKATKIHALHRDTLDFEQLEYVVTAVSRIVSTHLNVPGISQIQRDQIIAAMKNIRLPERSSRKASHVHDTAAELRRALKEMDEETIMPPTTPEEVIAQLSSSNVPTPPQSNNSQF